MASLDSLISIDGVMMACEFTPSGECVDVRLEPGVAREVADNAGQYIATVSMMFNTLAGSFTQLSGMNWVPMQAWTYTGGDWTVVANGSQAVFADTDRVDLNLLLRALTGKATAEQIRHTM